MGIAESVRGQPINAKPGIVSALRLSALHETSFARIGRFIARFIAKSGAAH